MISVRTFKSALKVLWAIGTFLVLFWVYRSQDDPIGEMVIDQDLIDPVGDDLGEDVDDEE